MAAVFESYKARGVGTTAHFVIDGGSYSNGIDTDAPKQAIMIGCMISNILTTSITVTAAVAAHASTNHTRLCKDLPIPAGDTVEIVQGKVVLMDGDDIAVTASTSSACDVVLSLLKDA